METVDARDKTGGLTLIKRYSCGGKTADPFSLTINGAFADNQQKIRLLSVGSTKTRCMGRGREPLPTASHLANLLANQ